MLQIVPFKEADIGRAIDHDGNKLVIRKSSFYLNYANIFGGAVFLAMEVSMEELAIIPTSSFGKNSAIFAGGIYNSTNISSCNVNYYGSNILNCMFKRNTAGRAAGAINARGKEILVKSSSFLSNTAMANRGEAGALYLSVEKTCEVRNCTFKSNEAKLHEGVVLGKGTQLSITDSVILSFSYLHDQCFSGGELLYSVSRVILENVYIHTYIHT